MHVVLTLHAYNVRTTLVVVIFHHLDEYKCLGSLQNVILQLYSIRLKIYNGGTQNY